MDGEFCDGARLSRWGGRLGLRLNGWCWSKTPVSRFEHGSGAIGPSFHGLAASSDSAKSGENVSVDIATGRHPPNRIRESQKAWEFRFVGNAKGGIEFANPVIDASRARTSSIAISGIWLLVSIAFALRMHCVRIIATLILLRFLPPRFCGFLSGRRFVAPDFRLYSNPIVPKTTINNGDFAFVA